MSNTPTHGVSIQSALPAVWFDPISVVGGVVRSNQRCPRCDSIQFNGHDQCSRQGCFERCAGRIDNILILRHVSFCCVKEVLLNIRMAFSISYLRSVCSTCSESESMYEACTPSPFDLTCCFEIQA